MEERVQGTWRLDTAATWERIEEVPAWKRLDASQREELRNEVNDKTDVALLFRDGALQLYAEKGLLDPARPLAVYQLEHLQKAQFRATRSRDAAADERFTMTLKLLDEEGTQLRIISDRFLPWLKYVVWRKTAE
jgi:hypothetical protein